MNGLAAKFVVSASLVAVATSALASIGQKAKIAAPLLPDQQLSADMQRVSKEIDLAFQSGQAKQAVMMTFGAIANNLMLSDGVSVFEKYVSPDVKLAWAGGQQDSTDNSGAFGAFCYTNCYSNCHSACHGSRGWR